MSDLTESMFDHSLQIALAIHVPTMLATGDPCDDLLESIKDRDFDAAAKLLDIDPDLLVQAAHDEELGWLLRHVDGWLVCALAPKVGPWRLDDSGNPRGRSLYLGWRVERWFRADTYEAAVQQAIDWVAADPAELVKAE